MTKEERRLVTEIRDTSTQLLLAKNYAETYLLRLAFIKALEDLEGWSRFRRDEVDK